MRKETLAAQAAHNVDPSTGAVTTPIHLSTTFERDEDGGYSRGYVYTRSNNPNRESLEECLYKLEDGAAAACFSSGSAATGTAAGLKALMSKGKIKDEKINVIAFCGDGGGADMGLSAISGSLMHQQYNLLILMYDNESYANTDIQASGSSPWGVNTTFTLELVPVRGAVLYLDRTTPVSMNIINFLD